MNKKHFLFIACLAALLTSCLFDSDEDGLSNWLSDKGLPDNYKVEVLNIEGLMPTQAMAYRDTTPTFAESRIVFGESSKLSHQMALQFLYGKDSSFLGRLDSADTTDAFVSFYLQKSFYSDKDHRVKVLPIKEKLKVNVSWIFYKGEGRSFTDSVGKIKDSVWLEELNTWNPDVSFDTTYSLNVKKADSLVFFDLPQSFMDSVKTCRKACRIEMRFAAPESENLYRFDTYVKNRYPVLRMRAKKNEDSTNYFKSHNPNRIADVIENMDCTDCYVLHGGDKDSLVVEYPSEPILKALSEFYGDDFPYTTGDGFDVRQAVVLAQLTVPRDDAGSENHLGLPIRVIVESAIESDDGEISSMEGYRLNTKDIDKNGHRNIVFYEGDSLTLQVTFGVRDFINRAKDKESLKVMTRLFFPLLQDKDSLFATHLNEDGDTCRVYLSHYDYARYDFSAMAKNPATLKLWLATKRGTNASLRGDEE